MPPRGRRGVTPLSASRSIRSIPPAAEPFPSHGYVAGEADKHLHAGLRREVEEVGVAPAPPLSWAVSAAWTGPHIEYAPRRGAVHVLRGAQGGEGNFGDRLGQGPSRGCQGESTARS